VLVHVREHLHHVQSLGEECLGGAVEVPDCMDAAVGIEGGRSAGRVESMNWLIG
jgi:hypothetical protein